MRTPVNLKHSVIGSVLALILLSVFAATARAQETRTVTIVDGKVTVNGRDLPRDAVPEAIRSFDGRVSFTFDGEEEPVVGFGDRLYRLEADRIVEVSPDEYRRRWAAFAGPTPDLVRVDSAVSRLRVLIDDGNFVRAPVFSVGPEVHIARPFKFEVEMDLDSLQRETDRLGLHSEAMRSYAEAMRDMAVNIREVIPPPSGRFSHRTVPGAALRLDPLSDETLMERLEDARIHVHVRNERELDEESLSMAREIRRTTSPELRRELESDLRQHLEKIFETRQENRRAEIRELEDRLAQLQERLERREELRDRIIRERMEFLLRDQGAASGD